MVWYFIFEMAKLCAGIIFSIKVIFLDIDHVDIQVYLYSHYTDMMIVRPSCLYSGNSIMAPRPQWVNTSIPGSLNHIGWCNGSHSRIGTWWHHQMETFFALLALCAGNSPHKGQWCGALMFSLICAWINAWVNNHETGDLRRHRAHYEIYDVIVMIQPSTEIMLTYLKNSLTQSCGISSELAMKISQSCSLPLT